MHQKALSERVTFKYTSFKAFTVVIFQVEVFWVVTLCSVVGITTQKTSTFVHIIPR